MAVGRVVRELELSKTASGKTAGRFTIVIPSGKKDEEGKGIDDDFYNVETFNEKQQSFFEENLKKGELAVVKGNLDIRVYEKTDGGKGTDLVIQNPEVTFLGKGNNAGKATISVTGNLVCDPEKKNFEESGKTKSSFTVAANNPLAKDGDANYLLVECWDDHAKVADYLKKGSHVNVYGTIKVDTYQKDNGTKGMTVKVVNPEITFLDKKSDAGTMTEAPAAEAQRSAQKAGDQK
jgi:single-stranded DNA-binding protein